MRKISIITERRADFSRFLPIIKNIEKDDELEYSLIVTGNHLLKNHGYTKNEILQSGIKIDFEFKMFDEESADSTRSMSEALGRAIIQLPKIIESQKPDLILSGFDIAANLAITIVGAHMNIPVFHIQGGEVTGTIDESIRHAMSKFAHYHFAANEDACDRLIKLGELPSHVFNVGCPSIDALLSVKNSPKILKELEINKPYFLVLQHPVTTEFKKTEKHFIETIKALRAFPSHDKIFILPNNDAGYSNIVRLIEENDLKYIRSLSIDNYVNLLRRADALIGNSSSGIHETPTFNVPTVNIGTRQNARMRSNNVFDATYSEKSIIKAINLAQQWKGSEAQKIYGLGDSASRIIEIMKKADISDKIIQKQITY